MVGVDDWRSEVRCLVGDVTARPNAGLGGGGVSILPDGVRWAWRVVDSDGPDGVILFGEGTRGCTSVGLVRSMDDARETGLLLDDRDQTVGWMRGSMGLVFARSP